MKIVLISGSRSDRNALVMVEKALNAAKHNAWLIEIELVSGGHGPWAAICGATNVGFAYGNHGFDLAIIHGDRHEMVATALALNVNSIPIVHIGGGDLTVGSQDDCFRHAITKLSHLHFASNQDSADRIVQMGEEPDRVHVTGDPGIDMVITTETLGRDETFEAVDLVCRDRENARPHHMAQTPQRTILVLFHPETLSDTGPPLKSLSDALMARSEVLVLLGPNADAGGDLIRKEWQRLAQDRPDTVYHDTVEPQVFYSLLKWCDVLVGNSSAGFYEAPFFGTYVVNVGDRQTGRPRPRGLMYCKSVTTDISDLISTVLEMKPIPTGNALYGDGHAAERIAKVIGGIEDPRALLRKQFHQRRLMESWETVTS